MKNAAAERLFSIYEQELLGNVLPFWEQRSLDWTHGGYLNCFDNRGNHLVSTDKYTWSQGRFMWIWSKLSQNDKPFSLEQRSRFLDYALLGKRFLKKHALLAPDDWRCVFLTDAYGNPKLMPGQSVYDASIYADCFVVIGFARYALAAKDVDSYQFAKRLYDSVVARINTGAFHTLPYPLGAAYRAHGIPMILNDVSKEVYRAALQFDAPAVATLRESIRGYAEDVLQHFAGDAPVIHEVIGADNNKVSNLLGQHVNPGHSLEDIWFLMDAMDILEEPTWLKALESIALRTLEIGWDREYGGLLHYCGMQGGQPVGDIHGVEQEPMLRQVLDGWGDKLWWVHSEALYTTLLLYLRTGNLALMDWHQRIREYTFAHFPNPDKQVGEWIQILTREGAPQEKCVALPVKDPYHIIRNLVLMLELLAGQEAA